MCRCQLVIPSNRVVVVSGREHIDVSVAVHVDGEHRARTVCGGRDDVRAEAAAAPVQVLVPRDSVVV